MATHRRFFDNPDFIEYVRLLATLHVAIKEGWDETAEGEALRERMDNPGSRLSREEVASLNGISADFYSLMDDPSAEGTLGATESHDSFTASAEVPPITAEATTDLEAARQARESKDFNTALELFRKHEAH